MDKAALTDFSVHFLDCWTSQDVGSVLSCYTDDLVYLDPNTRGEIRGGDAFGRYLAKLFSAWRMEWKFRDAHPHLNGDDFTLLWRGSFMKPGGGITVEADGMDLVQVKDGLITRNEVYFDRSALAELMK